MRACLGVSFSFDCRPDLRGIAMAYRTFMLGVLSVAAITALHVTRSDAAGAAPPSDASKQCSIQADAKFLTGKTRKKFRAQCMRDARKAARKN